MYKLAVIYGKFNSPDEFDHDYYISKHMPLVMDKLSPRRAEVDRLVSSVQGEAPFEVIANLYFDSQDDAAKALTKPEAAEVLADLRNFYKGRDIKVAISEVKEITG